MEIKEEELLRYNITFDEIVRAIQNNNQDVSGGEIKSEEEEYLIRLRSRSADPNKIGNIILRGETNGGFIHIRDVADVKIKFADSPNKQWTNGKPSVSINVEKLPEEDLDEITEYAIDYIEEFNNRNLGVEIIVSRAYLDILQSRLDLLTRNGMLGLVPGDYCPVHVPEFQALPLGLLWYSLQFPGHVYRSPFFGGNHQPSIAFRNDPGHRDPGG